MNELDAKHEFLKLEVHPIWKEANDLAEYIYAKLADFPEDEKWHSQLKLRTAVTELIFYVAQAVGSCLPLSAQYDWANSRKYAAALKTMYRFVGRQKFIKLDPEIMVRLEKLVQDIDKEIIKSADQDEQQYQRNYKKDMKPWLEKHAIWQTISREVEK